MEVVLEISGGSNCQGLCLASTAYPTFLNGWGYTREIFGLAMWVVKPIFLGSIVYGAKFPERNWPGKFDFVGNSHNIWHVVTAVSAIMGCEVMGGMFEVARKGVQGCEERGEVIGLRHRFDHRKAFGVHYSVIMHRYGRHGWPVDRDLELTSNTHGLPDPAGRKVKKGLHAFKV
ncbi:hypothetical protein B0T16DRAFT_69684 [Cercophora newfieldiana]|uniref:Uncharacterized protein n=1 Tax=Cercophora newfieldiana TaxID=92897 RepID=A0AA39YSN4_9PEZI|nr:hypothetical protein B0T16DRAFT_69684 [Cercophora newfieldiana]